MTTPEVRLSSGKVVCCRHCLSGVQHFLKVGLQGALPVRAPR